jgi:hypothetical protein
MRNAYIFQRVLPILGYLVALNRKQWKETE